LIQEIRLLLDIWGLLCSLKEISNQLQIILLLLLRNLSSQARNIQLLLPSLEASNKRILLTNKLKLEILI